MDSEASPKDKEHVQHSLARHSDADFGEIQKPSDLPKEKCIAPRPLQSEDEQLSERDCRFVWYFKELDHACGSPLVCDLCVPRQWRKH